MPPGPHKPAHELLVHVPERGDAESAEVTERRIGREAPEDVVVEDLDVALRRGVVVPARRFDVAAEAKRQRRRRDRHDVRDGLQEVNVVILLRIGRLLIRQHRQVRLGIKHALAASGVGDRRDL